MGSAGKRPMEMTPRGVEQKLTQRRGKHSELEAWEDECYFKCNGNLLKGFQWRKMCSELCQMMCEKQIELE